MRQQDLLDIGTAADLRSFESGLVKLAGELDFPLVSGALVVKPPGQIPVMVVVGNTPAAYQQAHIDPAAAQRDPVVNRLKRVSVPVIYDQQTYVGNDAGDLWEHQARFGYHTGIAVALHLPNHRLFMLGVDRRDPLPKADRDLTRLMGDLQLVAVHAQDAALRLLTHESPSLGDEVAMTPREIEVLKLTMDGCTSAQISNRLSISIPTVNFHVRNLREKLGASNKHQAVLRAMALGLL
jgi:DNA-binding CsgD family transcriptional regulator